MPSLGVQRLADALDILDGVLGGKMPEQLAGGVGAALEEGAVGGRHRVELGLGRLAVHRHLGLGRRLGIAADRIALADAARVEGDDIVLLLKLGDVLLHPHGAEFLENARTGAARQDQQHALALGGIEGRRAAETQRELGAIGVGVVDRQLQPGTFGVRHVTARRPCQSGLAGLRHGRRSRAEGERQCQSQSCEQRRQTRHGFSFRAEG